MNRKTILCEKHTNVSTPGACPICMMEEIADLKFKIKVWMSVQLGTSKALHRYMNENKSLKEFGKFQLNRAEKLLKESIPETPLKQATPSPSADCLPGYEAVEVSDDGYRLLYRATGPDGDYGAAIDAIIGNIDFSGRYGYKREDGTVAWLMFSRAFSNSSGHGIATDSYNEYNTPVLPDFVEMKQNTEINPESPEGGL